MRHLALRIVLEDRGATPYFVLRQPTGEVELMDGLCCVARGWWIESKRKVVQTKGFKRRDWRRITAMIRKHTEYDSKMDREQSYFPPKEFKDPIQWGDLLTSIWNWSLSLCSVALVAYIYYQMAGHGSLSKEVLERVGVELKSAACTMESSRRFCGGRGNRIESLQRDETAREGSSRRPSYVVAEVASEKDRGHR